MRGPAVRERSLLMKKSLLILMLVLVSCAGTTKKTSTKFDSKKIPKGQSSYYYFLMSQIKDTPTTEAESGFLLEQALKKDDQSSYLWAQKALEEAKKSNWNVALQYAEKSLSKNPKNVDSLILMGKLFAARKRPQKAVSYYRRALAIDRKIEEVYTIMAREYLTLSDRGSSIQTLKTCLYEIPDSMACLYYIATIQLQFKNFNEALKYFSMIRELNPENPKILQTIGEIYLQKKNYKKAIDVFSQLKAMNPDDLTQSIRLGLIYYELKQNEQAIQEFLTVHKRFPKSDRINYFLGLLYQEKKEYDLALDHFNKIRANSPFFKEAFNRIIYLSRLKGDVNSTVNLLDKKISKKDQTAQFYNLKISLLVFDGDYKKALSVANQGLSRFPNSLNLLFHRGIILEKLDRWEESKKDFNKIIETQPKSAKAYNYLGYTMLERGEDVDESMRLIQMAVKMSPKDGHIIDSLAWAYFKKRDYPKALNLLFKADRLKPNEPTILEHLGDVYFSMKNKRKARFYFEKAIQILEKVQARTPDEKKQLRLIREKLGKF